MRPMWAVADDFGSFQECLAGFEWFWLSESFTTNTTLKK